MLALKRTDNGYKLHIGRLLIQNWSKDFGYNYIVAGVGFCGSWGELKS